MAAGNRSKGYRIDSNPKKIQQSGEYIRPLDPWEIAVEMKPSPLLQPWTHPISSFSGSHKAPHLSPGASSSHSMLPWQFSQRASAFSRLHGLAHANPLVLKALPTPTSLLCFLTTYFVSWLGSGMASVTNALTLCQSPSKRPLLGAPEPP